LSVHAGAEVAVRGFFVAAADGARGAEEGVAGEAEAEGDEGFLAKFAEEFCGAGFFPEFTAGGRRVSQDGRKTMDGKKGGEGEMRRVGGKRGGVYSSSSKEEGMGVSPEALAGIGARDMVGGDGVFVEDVVDDVLVMLGLLFESPVCAQVLIVAVKVSARCFGILLRPTVI